jgi:hypothetical protein
MKNTLVPIAVVLLLITGCATVPKESVELSMELTRMIRSAEESHLALLGLYIAERKDRATDFLEKVWTPTFMENATSSSKIGELVEKEHDPAKKDALIKEFTGDAAVEITKRRASLTGAIDKIDAALRKAITDHYADMLAVNYALTAHLSSAADMTEIRTKLLSTLKVDPQSILPLDKINGVLEKILSYQGKAEELTAFVDEVKSILKGK